MHTFLFCFLFIFYWNVYLYWDFFLSTVSVVILFFQCSIRPSVLYVLHLFY